MIQVFDLLKNPKIQLQVDERPSEPRIRLTFFLMDLMSENEHLIETLFDNDHF